jgi:hypothetical protein
MLRARIGRFTGCSQRTKLRKPAGYDRGLAAHDEHQEPIVSEPVEVAGHDAFGSTNGSGNLPGCGSGVRRDVREDHSITAVAGLHQVLAEQPGRTDAEAQCRGEGAVIVTLRGPRVQGAERQEDGGSEAGGSEGAIRQVGLLGAASAARPSWTRIRAAVATSLRRMPRRPASLH